MRGDEHANIHANRLVAADALDFALFEHAQQFRLHGDGHVANFVEKQRAAFGLFEFANVLCRRAGECSLFMAEELRFDQFRRNRRAIQRDECIFMALRLFMNRSRDQLFAGSRFAKNTNTRFACGHAIDLCKQLLHRRTRSNQLVLSQPVAQLAVFVFEARKPQRIFYRDEQLVRRERLLQEIQRAQLRGFDRHLDIRLPGDKNDRCLNAGVFQIFEQLDAAFSGHDHVGKNQVEGFGAQKLQSARRVVANGGFVASEPKSSRQRSQRVGVVIDEQKVSFAWQMVSFAAAARQSEAATVKLCGGLFSAASASSAGGAGCADCRCGSSMRNVVPRPSSLETEMVP